MCLGLPTYRAPQRKRKRSERKGSKKPLFKTPGFAYEQFVFYHGHELIDFSSTGFITVTRQKRALNVDYDNEGNEIVPDDVPQSDDDISSSGSSVEGMSPLPKKIPGNAPPPPPQDRSKIPPLFGFNMPIVGH